MQTDDTISIHKRNKLVGDLISDAIANIIFIAIVLKAKIAITEIFWLYLCEGVLVGIGTFWQIFKAEYFNIKHIKAREKRESRGQQPIYAYFAAYYFGFYYCLGIFIVQINPKFNYSKELLVMVGIIIVQNIFSYTCNNKPWGDQRKYNLPKLFALPFMRFVPLSLLFFYLDGVTQGHGYTVYCAVAFMVLKFCVDIITSIVDTVWE